MKISLKWLVLMIVTTFALGAAACGSAPVKSDETPGDHPTSAPADDDDDDDEEEDDDDAKPSEHPADHDHAAEHPK